MTVKALRFLERLALAALALPIFALLASCGSGAVGGSATATDPNRVTLLPGTGTVLYAGVPTTFTMSGGTGAYIVTSSNQSILPIPDNPRPTFTVVPNQVAADTDVTITVRDTGTAPLATAVVTVKPGTINNDIQITPSVNQGADCPTGTLCSGGDALVSVTLSQGGIALAGRTVRFDAVTGDFRFFTPDSFTTSTTAVTDESGRASVRIRALADAPNQVAVLQVTDVASGAFRRVSFNIAQSTGASPGFFATPPSYTFQGPRQGQCANVATSPTLAATFFIFGGTPPYTVTSPTSALVLSRAVVSSSGGSFDVRPTGVCVTDVPIAIRDASGHTTTVTVSNIPGTAAVPPLSVSPDVVSLSSCSSIATVTAVGGTGNYVATSGSGAIVVNFYAGNTFQIQRTPNSPATTSPLLVGVSDGTTTRNVTVNLTGAGAGACPTPAFDAQPRSVFLNSCTGTAQVILSGGSGVYSASSNTSGVKAVVNGNTLTIGRNPGPQAGPGVIVMVSDGVSAPISISVNDQAGPCT